MDKDTRMDEEFTEGGPEDAFDERSFLRQVRLKSVLRTVLVSLAVIALLSAVVLGGAYKWYTGTFAEANRIDDYYPDLVAISHPNTRVMGPSVTRWHVPGASNDYASFRLIGERPIPAGVRSVDFDMWSAEFLRGYDERWTVVSGRMFSGAGLVPELRFLYPLRKGVKGTQDEFRPDAVRSFQNETRQSRQRLASTPPSFTAEVAYSFDRLLTLDELESFADSKATLAWGAVNVWKPDDAPIAPPMNPGNIVGVPFVSPEYVWGSMVSETPQEAERNLPRVLKRISSRTMIGTADKTRTSAEYLDKNGVRYYGVVLTGPPAELLRLSRDPRVTGVSYGLAAPPWE